MEDNLTLSELQILLVAGREAEHRRFKFMAALQGVDIDKDSPKGAGLTGDDVKRRVEAKLAGKSEEQMEFASIGISYDSE